jgi:hypothetical protein
MGIPTVDTTFRLPSGIVGPRGNNPGDNSAYGVDANGQPLNRLTALKAAYDRGEIPFEKLFEHYQMPSKYPEVSGATSKAFGDIAGTDKGIGSLDFNALKAQFGGANAEMANRYNQFQASNNIGDYAANQRALDAQSQSLTNQYATTARGQLGQAEDVLNRYGVQGQGALDKYLQNAQDFYNKDIPASVADAQARATGYVSRYGIGAGGGASSAIGQIAGRSAVQAALPFQIQGRQYMGEALGRYQPFYSDLAARQYGRIANLNMPTESNIYGLQQGNVLQRKATEQQLQNLDLMVKERGYNAAVQNLRNQGLSESIINSLVSEWQAQKSRSLGLVGQAAGLEQQYGGERGNVYIPGSGPITQPQYYGLPQPNFPTNFPSRYSLPPPTQPGNTFTGYPPVGGTGNNPPPPSRIEQVMAYSRAHPPANPYGGQYPGGALSATWPQNPQPIQPEPYNPNSYDPAYSW